MKHKKSTTAAELLPAKAAPALSSYELGEHQRKTYPRAALADWDVTWRRHTPQHLLDLSFEGRVPALVQIKNQRMAASAFGFFRGAAPVMSYDLARAAAAERGSKAGGGTTGIQAQLCGDAHIVNLGAFAGDDGRLIFDLNDFDETLPGPFEWDVKRMATSILLAGAEAKIKSADSTRAVEVCLQSYAKLIGSLARMPLLVATRWQVHRLGAIAPISKILAKAERATPEATLETLTEETAAGRRFRSEPPLLRPVTGDEARGVLAGYALYKASLQPERQHFLNHFTPRDVAFKVVGTGSVGLRSYVIYLEAEPLPGKGGKPRPDVLFMQIKQEVHSCLAPYTGVAESRHQDSRHQGQRAVNGQRALQFQSDPLLGWTSFGGHDYLVRQLNDHKASVDLTKLKAPDLVQYAEVCGELLARGHARSANAKQIAGYVGNGARFQEAITQFAAAYAEQTVADWKVFVKAHPQKS